MVEIHPYIADLPIFQDRVDAMAESIAEIGLLHPISLDSEGRVIGGRHRLAACEKVGVEPQFETREENPLVFMLHDNDDRKHQTTGQLTAERAMTLHSAGHRSNGRWDYGEVAEFYTGVKFAGSENVRLSEAGVVLDFLGRDVLAAIAAGTETLKEQLAIAKAEKQRREAEERARVEEARDEQKREDSAGRYFDNHQEAKAWLDEKPQGAFPTMREAYAAYMEHSREARRVEEAKRKEEEKRQRELNERYERTAGRLRDFINGHHAAVNLKTNPDRAHILEKLTDYERTTFLEIEESIHA
nr:ParB N-terminal domain-containing protein [Corynebacterium amycolatum]